MKIFRIFVLMVFLMVSVSQVGNAAETSLSSAEKEKLTQQLIDKKDFIGLFKNAKKIGYFNEHGVLVISDAAFKYIKGCCNTEKDIIKLLEKNDFEVYLGKATDKKPKRIIGEKHVLTFFLIIGLTYQVYVDFENEKPSDVRAYVISTAL